MKKSEIIDSLWQEGYFETYRRPVDVSRKIWADHKIYAGKISVTLMGKKYLGNNPQGWRQLYPPKKETITKTEEINEISKLLGQKFKKEIEELKIALKYQPNCTAFLMRKILEKLLFIIICKSNKKPEIDSIRSRQDRLPNLTELLNISKTAEINNQHILTPKNIKKLGGSKFLGDTSAHDYLTSVSFEDIQNEISIWRISIKELYSNL